MPGGAAPADAFLTVTHQWNRPVARQRLSSPPWKGALVGGPPRSGRNRRIGKRGRPASGGCTRERAHAASRPPLRPGIVPRCRWPGHRRVRTRDPSRPVRVDAQAPGAAAPRGRDRGERSLPQGGGERVAPGPHPERGAAPPARGREPDLRAEIEEAHDFQARSWARARCCAPPCTRPPGAGTDPGP